MSLPLFQRRRVMQMQEKRKGNLKCTGYKHCHSAFHGHASSERRQLHPRALIHVRRRKHQ